MNTALRIVTSGDLNVAGKRDYISSRDKADIKYGILFSDFIATTVARKVKRMGSSYAANYKTVIYHLNKFSELNDASLFTNSINEEFLDDFILYLEEQGLKQTYIKNLLSLIKAMARKAATHGYAIDATYDDVTIDDEAVFSVYLSMNEITRIYYYKGLTRFQGKIRDLFIIGCLTGLRYSDYSTLKSINFQGDYIVKVTKKTNKKVVIPIHDYVREIYNKRDGNVSAGLTIQHFNRYMKMICKMVGIDDPITFNYTKGGKLVTETKPKWILISSHTARRSAATNLYMTGRLKTFEIMTITGHTTEESFFKYIKTNESDISKHVGADQFFRK